MANIILFIKKILRRLIILVCNKKEGILNFLIDVLSQDYTNVFVNKALHSHEAILLPPLAENLHRRNLTDRERCYLAYAARADFHYSQEGEDLVLNRILGEQEKGYFVDVGAHHPFRFSNTYALYRKGWRGINIDATPGSMAVFRQWRPQDINIEAAVSDTAQPMAFHMFKESALNTLNAVVAETFVQAGWERLEIKDIVPRPLSDILDEHLPSGTKVDLMNIDVEGGELDVLRSNNWEKYAPRYLILEVLNTPLSESMNAPTIIFLCERGYEPISKLFHSIILRRELS